MEKRELAFAEELLRLVSAFGLGRLEYITAEFEPFSAQRRPDLILVPSGGAYANTTVVVEFRFPRNEYILRGSLLQIPERRDFVAEVLNTRPSAYICIVDIEAPEFSKALLLKQGIRVLDKIPDPRAAADALCELLQLK
jgi:hypothetical protein